MLRRSGSLRFGPNRVEHELPQVAVGAEVAQPLDKLVFERLRLDDRLIAVAGATPRPALIAALLHAGAACALHSRAAPLEAPWKRRTDRAPKTENRFIADPALLRQATGAAMGETPFFNAPGRTAASGGARPRCARGSSED